MSESRRPRIRISGRSIHVRVTLATALVVAVTLATGGAALVILLHQLLVAGIDSAQMARAHDLSGQAQSGALTGTIPGTTGDTSLVQIVSSNGAVVASTSNVAGESAILAAPPSSRAAVALTIAESPLDTGSNYRLVASPVNLPSGPGWIYVASSLGQIDAAVNQLRTLFLIALPVVVVIISVIAWFAVRLSLRPVETIRRRAAAITAADLSQRVPIPAGGDEISLLATTMNDMLGRIERAARRQRQFVGDASHELRSPLAALQIQLDVALSEVDSGEVRTELTAAREQVARMTMLIDDLLFLASSTEPTPMVLPAEVDLDELVFAEADRLRELGGPTVSAKVLRAIRVRGSSRDLARMLRNLGDNAHDHAGSAIEISLNATNTTAEIVVRDDGSGIEEADRERIFARFSRLDDSRVRDTRGGGSGLGLSIARQIAESAYGTIRVRDPADGGPGIEFVVRLPVVVATD